LVAIGNGNINFAKKFRQEYPFIGELYVDTKLDSYKAFKLQRGLWQTFGPSLHIGTMVNNMWKGKATMGSVEGDALQQGGTFIIGPTDNITFGYLNKHTGDHPSLESILEAAKEI